MNNNALPSRIEEHTNPAPVVTIDDPAVQDAAASIERARKAVAEATEALERARDSARRRRTASWDAAEAVYNAAVAKAWDERQAAFNLATAQYEGAVAGAQKDRNDAQRALDGAWTVYHDAMHEYTKRLQQAATGELEDDEEEESA